MPTAALTAGMSGYLRRETTWYEQGLLLAGGGLMIALRKPF
jgi:hypothetical protein